MENNELKKGPIKNHTCYYFNDIIKLENWYWYFNRRKITQKYFDLWHFVQKFNQSKTFAN